MTPRLALIFLGHGDFIGRPAASMHFKYLISRCNKQKVLEYRSRFSLLLANVLEMCVGG